MCDIELAKACLSVNVAASFVATLNLSQNLRALSLSSLHVQLLVLKMTPRMHASLVGPQHLFGSPESSSFAPTSAHT